MSKRPVIENRKARHDYFISDELECGIVLRGHEIKSIIAGKANIGDAWCSIANNELILHNMFISAYGAANTFDVSERRDRKLLAHRREILKLNNEIAQKGKTLVPLRLYFKESKCKLLVGVGTGKHNYDKKNDLKERDMKRDIDRSFKG